MKPNTESIYIYICLQTLELYIERMQFVEDDCTEVIIFRRSSAIVLINDDHTPQYVHSKNQKKKLINCRYGCLNHWAFPFDARTHAHHSVFVISLSFLSFFLFIFYFQRTTLLTERKKKTKI